MDGRIEKYSTWCIIFHREKLNKVMRPTSEASFDLQQPPPTIPSRTVFLQQTFEWLFVRGNLVACQFTEERWDGKTALGGWKREIIWNGSQRETGWKGNTFQRFDLWKWHLSVSNWAFPKWSKKIMSAVTKYLNKDDLYLKPSVNYPWRPACGVNDISVNGKYRESYSIF